MAEILEYLEQAGVGGSWAVYTDIALLRDLGYDIIATGDKAGGYFLGTRSMERIRAEICAGAIARPPS